MRKLSISLVDIVIFRRVGRGAVLRGVSEKEAMRKGAFSKPSPDSVSKYPCLWLEFTIVVTKQKHENNYNLGRVFGEF